MSEAMAILIAAAVAVGGYLLNHALGRWAERKRAEERAVTDLASAAMSILSMSRFRRAFGESPLWRQLLPGSPPNLPKEIAVRMVEYGFLKVDEVVRAHGELIQHASKKLVDAASAVLDASLAVAEQSDPTEGDEAIARAEHDLGQARLRLYRASRGRRSWRWRLGRPALFENIDDRVWAANRRSGSDAELR